MTLSALPHWQVYKRICDGRAVLSLEILERLVRREVPLLQFKQLLECTDGLFNAFYVWTGELVSLMLSRQGLED